MKRTLTAVCITLALALSAFAQGTTHVKGHTTKSGKYVAPHERTRANGTKDDNWSTRGNVNPNTGKRGTKRP